MSRSLPVLVTLVALLGAAGCEQKTDGPAPAPSAAPAVLSEADLPTPSDFDDEAEGAISSSNYKSELDKLEDEIGKAD